MKHKQKGWHTIQEPAAGQAAPAVYLRPDKTVQADMSAASFPSLSPAPGQNKSQSSTPPKAASWATTSPDAKGKSQPASGSLQSPVQVQQKAQYAAALSPSSAQQPKHAAAQQRDGMALSDSELAAVTQLLSTHEWAEPGLVRVRSNCLPHIAFINYIHPPSKALTQ